MDKEKQIEEMYNAFVVLTKEQYKELTLAKQSIFKLLDEREDKTRKETAREILKKIIEVKKEVRFRVGMGEIFPHKDLIEKLYELAEKYGVEIGEEK